MSESKYREAKTRIQLDLLDTQRDALARVQEKLNANSFSEVFRRALVVLDKIVEREVDGTVRFGFVNEENEFTEVWFL
jgi:hypothetical protein